MARINSKLVSLVLLALFVALVGFASDALAGGPPNPAGGPKGESTGETVVKNQINQNLVNNLSNPNR
jgi:hypothetical protein